MTQAETPQSTDLAASEWLTDSNGHFALAIRHGGNRLFVEQSPYQTVEVFQTETFGKMLTIDSMVMCTEVDEAAYHEMIVHVPMQVHGDVRNVLVIGAGDGGTIRELMRYEQIERVTMVEIDDAVVRASKEFLPSISSAFGHPKLDLQIGDGIKFLQAAAAESYDLIVIDSSDPVGPSEGLFSEGFYRDVYRVLKTGGSLTVQSEGPMFNTSAFKDLNQCLKLVFGQDSVNCYLVFIPTYPTGMWSLTYCTKNGPHPVKALDEASTTAFTTSHPLRYYNIDVHRAAFCLPNHIKAMINE
ncbi:MAG: polyamine aminopropyltransferase [Alkalinema sp. RU_4_3]|nr:polyamine aminopropyltransferase [Alkalinema sp. RU_4_3]